MKIKDLLKPLSVENIEFRVDNIIKGREGRMFAQILAYKDARADMRIADEALGQENWQCDFVRDSDSSMICKIGVKIDGEWVWKAYNGTASNFESDKGTASDAFKRAWVMWGIGRHLYSFPSIFVELFEAAIERQVKQLQRLEAEERQLQYTRNKAIADQMQARFDTSDARTA